MASLPHSWQWVLSYLTWLVGVTLTVVYEDDLGLFKILSEESVEIFNSDILFTDDPMEWYGAFDECERHQRIFTFPITSKVMHFSSTQLGKREVWVELYKSEYGWMGYGGAVNISLYWEEEDEFETAPEQTCAVLIPGGKLSVRNCTELHGALCLNPAIFHGQRKMMPFNGSDLVSPPMSYEELLNQTTPALQ